MTTSPPLWRAWFDGSATPNPGRCWIGALLLGPDGERHEISRSAGDGDSSAAEYQALIAVLDLALSLGVERLEIAGDSKVVIDDVLAPEAKASALMRPWREQVRARLARLPACALRWVPRHRNQEADALSQRARQPAAHWEGQLAALAARHAGSDGAHDTQHLRRVWRHASLLLRRHPEADALTVMAACYLHDLVNLPKDHPERHLASTRSAELAVRELRLLDFPAARLEAVAHAIACHSYSAALAPATIEARIVQDADRLDALGAIGLARLWYTAGRLGLPLAEPSDPLGSARELNDRAWALDHIAVKLEALPGMMQTAAGRTLAQRRLRLLQRFRDSFAHEWLGD